MAQATGSKLNIYTAERPCAGEEVSGDAWTMQQHGDVYRISVIDGLGHGPIAHFAATTAVTALEGSPDLPALEALSMCHRALHSTRGTAMSIAEVNMATGQLVFCGIGNVEGIIWRAGEQNRLVPLRGIAGANAPTLRAFNFDLGSDWMMLLHSDGISSRVRVDAWDSSTPASDRQVFADGLLAEWGRDHDDVTVVIVCPNRS